MAAKKAPSRSRRVRIEQDLIGRKAVPANAYYGVQTARALENFAISGVPLHHYPDLIRALAMVKLAAARGNHEVGALPTKILRGIEKACADLLGGRLHDQFPIDVIQGGAGTSTNMNANEVIANRALEHMGFRKGDYEHCDPHDHVNLGQSTNDAYPSALHVAMLLSNDRLIAEFGRLVAAFRRKGRQFARIVKMGRTQLQDAVPMTLGQEFHAWAESLQGEIDTLRAVERPLCEVNMGGTAIGTGLNAPRGFSRACTRHLARIVGKPIHLAPDLIEATQDTQCYVLYSSVLKSLAIKLSKICNDLRLLASGPRAGLHEIRLPAMQPGSSIMPGKVNPVIPEVVNQVCFRVIGNDLTVTLAAEAGQLQLNVMEPVIAACIFEGQMLFVNAAKTLREHCIDGIEADATACRNFVERSIGVVTALNPLIGYDKSTELAAEAMRTGKGIVELVRERGLLSEQQIRDVLDPRTMVGGAARRGRRVRRRPRVRP
ncbi:MAG: aspartate ammonia-lyase [Planctomycetes bacterium]|nr:aspartate ammonia-lyase [Planctomycetota bacterium]